MTEQRTLWIIATQMKELEYSRKLDGEDRINYFQPTYLVMTSRLQMEKKLKKLSEMGTVHYAITEIKVSSYGIPGKYELEEKQEKVNKWPTS
jgi:hypothetical protein